MHFLGTDEEWNARSSSTNRSEIIDLINKNKANGLLSYLDGQVVGWCHATPRTNLKKLDAITGCHVNYNERIGSIVCFVVAAPYRRRGIARSLLDSACNVFVKWGLSIAEAYPNTKAETDAENWGGPLSLYLSAGFKPFRETKNRMIVRKLL